MKDASPQCERRQLDWALGRTMGGLVTYIAAIVSCTMTFLVIRATAGATAKAGGRAATGAVDLVSAVVPVPQPV